MAEKIGGNTFADYYSDFYSNFSYISIHGKEISIRKADSWVNVIHLLCYGMFQSPTKPSRRFSNLIY